MTAHRTTENTMPDYFDVFRRNGLRKISDLDERFLTNWSAADPERPETAARFVTGILLDHTRRAARSLGPGWLDRIFRRWLLYKASRKFRLSRAACANVRAVFERNPGQAVHDLYLHRSDL
jgi:hypothetical protein